MSIILDLVELQFTETKNNLIDGGCKSKLSFYHIEDFRSSPPEVFLGKGVLNIWSEYAL